MICECGATFRKLHPELNVCRCGTRYDGQGNAIEGDSFKLKEKKHERPAEPKPQEDVGTNLAKLIPTWATQFTKGCGCRDFERKMNAWGIVGCKQNEDEIVQHLIGQSDKLLPMFRAIPETGRRLIARNLLRRAIAATEKMKK